MFERLKSDEDSLKALKSTSSEYLLPKSKLTESKGNESCMSGSFSQPILIDGCKPVFITNKYCLGACNSLFIPQTVVNFKSCKACVPTASKYSNITLKCRDNGKVTFKKRLITVVHTCGCQEVECTGK